MSVAGKYVNTFAEASHAMLVDMHMDADYPFMIPRIVRLEGGHVVLREGDREGRFAIEADLDGRQCVVIAQSSTFEKMLRRRPMRFKALPFKNEATPAIGFAGEPSGQ